MNFAAARNAPMDPKSGRKENVIMSGTVTSVDSSITFTPNGAQKYKIELRDGGNEVSKVTIYPGTNPVMEQFHVSQFLEFNLSASQSKNGNWYYGGFWQCPNPQETQQPSQAQQAPSQNQQQAQAPPQQQNQQQPPQTPPPQQQQPQDPQADPNWKPRRSQEYAYEVTPVVAARIARSVALEAASRLMLGKAEWEPEDILKLADTLYGWVKTGNIPMTPAAQPGTDAPPQTDDDGIPF